MSDELSFLRAHPDGVIVALKVQPRASRNELGEILGHELKIKISAPPVDSAANQAVIEFLAELLHCPRSHVRLLRGHTSRHKQILIAGHKLETIASHFRDKPGGKTRTAHQKRC